MKKAISFVLAALMVVSAVPTTFATNDYTAGTKVEYTATGSESYTITVPAQLAPGGSGTVTLSGTWADNRIVTVTAEPSVTLTNSINSADQKVLDVGFAGISEAGSNTGSQTFTEDVSVADIENALFGSWSGKFFYNVEVNNAVALEFGALYTGEPRTGEQVTLMDSNGNEIRKYTVGDDGIVKVAAKPGTYTLACDDYAYSIVVTDDGEVTFGFTTPMMYEVKLSTTAWVDNPILKLYKQDGQTKGELLAELEVTPSWTIEAVPQRAGNIRCVFIPDGVYYMECNLLIKLIVENGSWRIAAA